MRVNPCEEWFGGGDDAQPPRIPHATWLDADGRRKTNKRTLQEAHTPAPSAMNHGPKAFTVPTSSCFFPSLLRRQNEAPPPPPPSFLVLPPRPHPSQFLNVRFASPELTEARFIEHPPHNVARPAAFQDGARCETRAATPSRQHAERRHRQRPIQRHPFEPPDRRLLDRVLKLLVVLRKPDPQRPRHDHR